MVRRTFFRVLTGTLMVLFVCSATLTSYAAKEGYPLGPADIISVSIFAGGEHQVAADLTISEQGFVNFPFIGPVKAAGMTSSELEKFVYTPLESEYFVEPQVHVRIKEFHSLHFSISGAVKQPGQFEMKTATKLMDLIAKAEGVTQESGKVAYIIRVGPGGAAAAHEKKDNATIEPLKVNLVKLLDEGDMSQNLALNPGDSVYIPYARGQDQAESKVYVSGEVKNPAPYDYQPGLTALSACIMAGGFAKYAAPNRTTIVRIEDEDQKVIKVDLDDVVKGKIPDVALKPGDRVNVPESWL